MADNVGQVTALTVITPIIPERLNTLKQVLAAIQANPSSTIAKISSIHFARWVVFDRDARLLFTSNFDGSFEDYIKDFVRDIPDGLDRIWGNCVGYPGSLPIDPFFAYIRAHSVPNTCFYAAYPHLTVKDVLNCEKWRTAGRKLVPAAQAFLVDVN
jgi:hypothetical protein